jgi:PiT family inorganic phosphate transporter
VTVGVVLVIALALAFDYTNGFHDAANAIAVAVSTKALTPRVALALAAVMNLVGALISTKVAKTVGEGIIDAPQGSGGLEIVFAALIGAITWNLITWYFGLPSSSSHALIGGLVGAALAASHSVQWMGILDKVVIPMVLSPLVGFGLGYLFMLVILWTFRRANVSKANRGFRFAQIFSSGTMALGHGLQDAQKTMGIITLALFTAGEIDTFEVPLWVVLAAAVAMSAGTYSGGFRIMRTLGRRIIQLTPAGGFSAQTVASGVMITTATVFAVPVSTTHITTTSIMGVGATRRLSAVRWGVAGNIVVAWIVTLPAAGAVAALAYFLTDLVIG